MRRVFLDHLFNVLNDSVFAELNALFALHVGLEWQEVLNFFVTVHGSVPHQIREIISKLINNSFFLFYLGWLDRRVIDVVACLR